MMYGSVHRYVRVFLGVGCLVEMGSLRLRSRVVGFSVAACGGRVGFIDRFRTLLLRLASTCEPGFFLSTFFFSCASKDGVICGFLGWALDTESILHSGGQG